MRLGFLLGGKVMSEEKCILTVSVAINEKTYSVSFDLNSIDFLTEQKARQCYEFLGPSVTWALRESGKIVNPLVFD